MNFLDLELGKFIVGSKVRLGTLLVLQQPEMMRGETEIGRKKIIVTGDAVYLISRLKETGEKILQVLGTSRLFGIG